MEEVAADNQQWNQQFAELSEFVERNGRRPRHAVREERRLARWLQMQVTRSGRAGLAEWQKARLESVGLFENPRQVRSFEQGLIELQAFVAAEGRVPGSRNQGEKSLHSWMTNQRTKESRGMLSAEELQSLTDIPGAIVGRPVTSTDEMIAEATKWCEDHGHRPVGGGVDRAGDRSPERKTELRIARWMAHHGREEASEFDPDRTQAIRKLMCAYPSRREYMGQKKISEVQKELAPASIRPASTSHAGKWLDRKARIQAKGEYLEPEEWALVELAAEMPTAAQIRDQKNLLDLKSFAEQHRWRPRTTAGATAEEAKLAWWVRRRRSRGDDLSDTLAGIIESLPMWKANAYTGLPAEKVIGEVSERLRLRGHLPSDGLDLRIIGKCEMAEDDDVLLPGYIVDFMALVRLTPTARVFAFQQRLDEYTTFLRVYRRRPQSKHPDERSLWQWAERFIKLGGAEGEAIIKARKASGL